MGDSQHDNPAATGYVLVFQYHDRSGILGAFGPYATTAAANDAEYLLKNMPLAAGVFETVPVFGLSGIPASQDLREDVIEAALAWFEVEGSDNRDTVRAAEHNLHLAIDALTKEA